MRDYIRSIIVEERTGILAELLKALFGFCSLIYHCLVSLHNLPYDRALRKGHSLPVPVVSVGNITWGGVGKTPLILAIARALRDAGVKPAVLLRGYMPKFQTIASDEAALLSVHLPDLPILVGKNRYQVARNFLKNSTADIFLLDDGFQHRSLARNLDIVAIDATNPLGNRWLIPRGILREPLGSLGRADIFVLTKSDLGAENIACIENELRGIHPTALIVASRHAPKDLLDLGSKNTLPIDSLRGKSVASLSGIGDPKSFEAMLQKLGVHVQSSFVFGDHHGYQMGDIKSVFEICRTKGIRFIITTEKDAVKLEPFLSQITEDIRCLALRIQVEFLRGKEELFDRIFSLLRS